MSTSNFSGGHAQVANTGAILALGGFFGSFVRNFEGVLQGR